MDILRGINDKNERVFKAFFEENFSSLLQFAGKYTDDAAVSADIAQECFIRLWNSGITFESENKAKGFLYTTARNLALNQVRHGLVAARHAQYALLESERYFQENVMEEEIFGLVYQAIDRLAPQSKKIILLALQGNSNEEVAKKLAVSVNTVNTLKQNAYKKLRGLLKDHFYLLFLIDFIGHA